MYFVAISVRRKREPNTQRQTEQPIETFYFGIDYIGEATKKREMKEKKLGNIIIKRANSSISSGPTYSFKSIPLEK